MAVHRIDRLTRREREIVNALFALGNSAPVEDIRRRLDAPPSNLYSATISPASAKRNALQHCLQTFFGGSRRLLLTSLVREGSWTDEDLDALREEIDRARKDRRKS